jgi:Pre-mRNA cleavage and polyadenylation specificity factor
MYREGESLVIGKIEENIENNLKQEVILVRKRCLETPRHILIHSPYIIVSFFTDDRTVIYHLKVFIYSEPSGFTEISSVQQFTENEVIMAMCICKFSRKLKPPFEYLVIGTGIIGTEDTTSQGRLILFAFDEGKLVYQALHKKPGLKGCVSALGCMEGYLLVGVGSEFKLFSFVDEEGQE